MTIPPTIDTGYEYTEFDGKPLEWWKARAKKDRTPIAQRIEPKDQKMLDALLPDPAMHVHIARISQSEQGTTTFLTTSAQAIQFQGRSEAYPHGCIVIPRNVDAKGIAILISHSEQFGHKVSADQIPFGKTADPAFKQHVRQLWAEAKGPQQQPEGATRGPAPNRPKAPAYA